jgi:hypothetical protein
VSKQRRLIYSEYKNERKEEETMKKVIKKVLALGLAAVLAFGSAQVPVVTWAASPTSSQLPSDEQGDGSESTDGTDTGETTTTRNPSTQGTGASSSGTSATTTGGKNGTSGSGTSATSSKKKTYGSLTVTSVSGTKKTKKVNIKGSVKLNGIYYRVTRIAANAFKNTPNATSLVIPSYVTQIDKNAFKGLKKLKTITFRIKSMKYRTIEKGAFNGLDTTKITIKVSKGITDKQLKSVKKAFKKAGFKGKIVRITS